MKFSLSVIFIVLSILEIQAQQVSNPADTMHFSDYLKKGKWSTQVRNYTMFTDNRVPLTDYHANALGIGMSYKTKAWKGFQVGFGGSFVYNTWSSKLSIADSLTGQFNRYEIGLFDIENPSQALIGRIEELYIKYHVPKLSITFGKQKLVTPWINPQDGRMRPNFQEGLYIEMPDIKKVKIEIAWLYRFLVRSTENWLSIAQSIGQYPVGITPDGVRSGYKNNLTSKGIGLLGLTYSPLENIKMQVWHYYTHNIFNTSFLQVEMAIPTKNKTKEAIFGLQGHYQTSVGNGGNENPLMAYTQKNHTSWAISSRIGLKTNGQQITFNYTHIGKHDRFLFPREWGRDPFYTFLPRERNEGFGGVNAVMFQWSQNFKKLNSKLEIGYGHYYLSDVNNSSLNKYGFPSYQQLNINFIHHFKGIFEGLQGQLLYVYKGRLGETYQNPRFEFNKVNMSLYNIIFNYNF